MVAARAGTSVATVSLVVNDKTKGRVSDENIERVRQAITDLNYIVDHAASSLARGTSNIILLVTPDVSNPFFGRVISGIQAEIGDRYQLLLSTTGEGQIPTAASVNQLTALRPAGLLIDAPNDAFLRDLPRETAVVLLDAPGDEDQAATVNFDLKSGVHDLVEHLHELGHRQIAYIAGRTGTETFLLRRRLLEESAAARGMVIHSADNSDSLINLDRAAEAFTTSWPEWHARGVTAVVCATDTHAYGALQAAINLGLRVPEDVAITGFDNLPYSTITSPPLTTVSLPGKELGRVSAQQLLAQIEGREVDLHPVLPARLIRRASTLGLSAN
nr:LacI family DNA-binding transcriptional regulator [Lysinibacter cavernae]